MINCRSQTPEGVDSRHLLLRLVSGGASPDVLYDLHSFVLVQLQVILATPLG